MRILQASIIVSMVLFGSLAVARAEGGSIIVSEIAYDLVGADDKHEWFEIYNPTDQPIDLTGWRLRINHEPTAHGFDFSPEKGAEDGALLQAGHYMIVADNAALFRQDHPSYAGILVDSILSLPNYSASRVEPIRIELLDGQDVALTTDSYLPRQATASGYTIEKVADQWQDSLQLGGTPGKAPEQLPSYPLTIRLSEIVSNPEGNDTDSEWIELENTGDKPVDLVGWYIVDAPTASGVRKKYTIPGGLVVDPHQYIVVMISGSLLNNADETLTLYSPSQSVIETITTVGEAKEGWSYGRQGDGWTWTSLATPGRANEIIIPASTATSAQATPSTKPSVNSSESGSSSVSLRSATPTSSGNNMSTVLPKASATTLATARLTQPSPFKTSPKPTKSAKSTKPTVLPSGLSQVAGISSNGPEPYRLGERERTIVTILLALVLLGSAAYRFRIHHWLMNRFRYGILKKNE